MTDYSGSYRNFTAVARTSSMPDAIDGFIRYRPLTICYFMRAQKSGTATASVEWVSENLPDFVGTFNTTGFNIMSGTTVITAVWRK
jgi:hypothetical protein